MYIDAILDGSEGSSFKARAMLVKGAIQISETSPGFSFTIQTIA